MNNKSLIRIGLMLLLSLSLGGCASAAAQNESSPEGVVVAFYSWYLDNLGYDVDKDEFHNPLQGRSYQDQGALSTDFIERIEQMKSTGFHTDPIVCAQDIPQGFSIREVDVSPMGEEARVRVETSFERHQFQVYLQKLGGVWKIAGVICMPGGEITQPPTG